MKTALLALALVGCSGSAKQPESLPTPTERAPDAAVAAEPAPQPVVAEQAPLADLETPPKPAGSQRGTQAQIAWTKNSEGIELMKANKYEEASREFRDAVARIPDAGYFFNLCVALYELGRFGEALTACEAARHEAPSEQRRQKADRMISLIRTAASRQHIKLE